uniref:Cell wall protein PRY3 n=1 Tax=Zeugodacus cucurbitae TaxID=28588 RepID=A0A0A1XHF1_ZEUCU
MGVVGSNNRHDPYRSPSPQNYQYYEQQRPQRHNREHYNVSGNVSEASAGPHIVVPATPYIDRPSEYEVRQRPSHRVQKQRPPKPLHSGADMCVREYGIMALPPQAPIETSTPRAPLRPPPPPTIQPQPQQQTVRNPIVPCNCKACRERDEKLAAYAAGPPAAATTTYVSPIEFSPTPAVPKRSVCTTDKSCNSCTGGSSRCAQSPQTATYSAAHSTAFDRSLNDTSRERSRRNFCEYKDDTYANTSSRMHQAAVLKESQTPQFRDEDYPMTSTRIHQDSMLNETQTPKYRDEPYPITSTRICNNTSARESQAHKFQDETYIDTSTRMHSSTMQNQSTKAAQMCCEDRMTPSGGATSDEVSDFHRECLDAHNRFRARHQNCPPLSLNNELCKYAQQWAKHLAATGRLEHRQVHTYGENLYTSRGMEVNGATAVQSWYDEIRNYDFSKATYKPGTGHFTQIVWRDSRQLGVGLATRGDTTYIVCNYNPPGNLLGSFDSMVPPLK